MKPEIRPRAGSVMLGSDLPTEFNHKRARALIAFAETIKASEYEQDAPKWEPPFPRCCLAGHYDKEFRLLISLTRNINKFFAEMLGITYDESMYIVGTRSGIVTAARKLNLPKPKIFGVKELVERIKTIEEKHTHETD